MGDMARRLFLFVLLIYSPVIFGVDQLELSTPIELSSQIPDLGGAYKSKIEGVDNGILVVVYGDYVENDPLRYVFDTKDNAERPARDVFITTCNSAVDDCSLSASWSAPFNLSNTAQLSSMQTDWNADGNRTDYYGDSDNTHMFSSGNHVVITWGDKYCPGGQQRSVTYLEFNSREIPMSCVYAAHATNTFAGLSDWTVNRLSDGSRDVKQDNNKGISSGVWAIVWQEDPLGLQPGEAEGPGEGSSGAKTSHGTDIWYTYTSNVASAVSDIGVWSTPVRITDNQTAFGLSGSFNPIKNTAGNSVDPSQIEKGNAGASRANLQVVGGSSPPNTVIAYEETKGSAGLDEGKFLRYHVFPYNSPPTSASDKAGCIISDPDENARRARFVAQTNAASGSGIRFAIFWRQGFYTQGGPADIMMRIGYQSADPQSTGMNPADLDPPVDPNCYALDYASAINLTSAAPLNLSSNTLEATQANLADATDANFLENARAHRAVLRANDLYVGYIYTEDGVVAAATDLANYNFFVRRFNASTGVWGAPDNLSNITDTTINVLEPRLMGMPGNQPGCTDPNNITNPENCQNKNVLVAVWGTETNVYEHIGGSENLDIYITRTTDKAAHWEPLTYLASGPNIQGESQLRVTPAGNQIFAVWNETSNGFTSSMFSFGSPITLYSDMAVSVSSVPTSVHAGDDIEIAYQLENRGPDKAYDIGFTINLPVSVQFLSANDFCANNAGVINCQLGDIDINNSVPVGISVRSTIEEALLFTASIVSDTLDDPDTGNNEVQSTVNATMASDLAITVSSSVESVDVGANISLLYQLVNQGPSDAMDVILLQALPAGASFVGAMPDVCSEVNGELSCAIGELSSSATSSLAIEMKMDIVGPVTFNATTSATQYDPDVTNNMVSKTITGIPNIDLALSGSVSYHTIQEGQHVTVTFSVVNQGPQPASNISMNIFIPGVWEQSSATITRGSCHISGVNLMCEIASLAIGESSTVELVGTVDGVMEIDIHSNVFSAENDLDFSNNAARVHVKFKEDTDIFDVIFGCAMTQGDANASAIDPTLLIIVLIALARLATRKKSLGVCRE
ncbi:choice-of-anchor O protein [Kaarinaea lacus]